MPPTPQITLFPRLQRARKWIQDRLQSRASTRIGRLVGYGNHPRQVFIVEDDTQDVLRARTTERVVEWVKGCPIPTPVEVRLETDLWGRHTLLQLASLRPKKIEKDRQRP